MFIKSWLRVSDKNDDFMRIFGYRLVDSIFPDAVF